jgi:hypothetical protein
MAELTVQQLSRAGIELSLSAAAAGGDSFPNNGDTLFVVKNGNTAERGVTFAIQRTVDSQSVTGRTVTAVTAATMLVGPFPTEIYNDSDGLVQVTYSSEADLTVGALRV